MAGLSRVVLTIEPGARRIELEAGTPFSEALELAGLDFAYPCARAKLCGECRVIFESGAPAPTDEEARLLHFDEIEAGVRLACCACATEDAVVRLPEAREVHTEHVLSAGYKRDVVVEPEVRKFARGLPPSTLEEPLSDWRRVVRALPPELRERARPTLSILRKLPEVVRCAESGDKPVTVTMQRNRVIEVECGDSSHEHYGVAVDLGTTTIAAVLVDMHEGTEIAAAGCMNPQRAFGHDLISRIHAVQTEPANLGAMHEKAIEAIGGLIREMCAERDIALESVRAMSLAGNTAMSHLFLRIDPRGLGQAPFAGALRAGVELEARDLGLPLHPHAPVYVLPCMGGFIGGDIVAGILMTKLEEQPGVSVLVDIGTNGEVVVAREGRLSATSSAAGPSFEGSGISCGMIAADGAIARVAFDGSDLAVATLGDGPARGICGSGLIEAFARSLETGLIDMGGRMRAADATDGLPPAIAARVRDGEPDLRLVLTPAADGQRETFITQGDVRAFQLGKGAVQAAIAMVLDEMGIAVDAIDRFLVAGAFGNHLNVADSMALGLLPDMPREKVFFVGNSSLEGARCVLLNKYERQRAERIAEECGFVELATRPEFQDHFAMAMMLGPAM